MQLFCSQKSLIIFGVHSVWLCGARTLNYAENDGAVAVELFGGSFATAHLLMFGYIYFTEPDTDRPRV